MEQSVRKKDGRELTEDKLEALRSVIIDLFSSRDFASVGIREICDLAKVTPKTIYKHFGQKDQLLIAAIAPVLKQLTDRMADIVGEKEDLFVRAQKCSHAYYDFYFSNPAVARIVFLQIPAAKIAADEGFVQREQLDLIEKLIAEGQEAGVIRADFSAFELVDALSAVSMRRMFHILTKDDQYPSAEEEAERQARLILPLISA